MRICLRRREFIAALGIAAAWPLAARAQQRVLPVIGYLSGRTADSDAPMLIAARRGLRIAILGPVVWILQVMPTTIHAAAKNAEISAAQKAMDECLVQYCGLRSSSVSGYRAMFIESCFHRKTGQYPGQMGVALKVHRRCSTQER
jgi:hypothetical protein